MIGTHRVITGCCSIQEVRGVCEWRVQVKLQTACVRVSVCVSQKTREGLLSHDKTLN